MEQKTVCMYPKDVQRVTGKSYRFARLLLIDSRRQLNKEEHQFISIEECCSYTGLKLE
ncbi:hypothetical protein BC952_2633 [Flavobacterium limicola]|uniref:Excisionase family DNA binding protein n=1 Tax=Flavobacterium limicola TaxID=180441 RepID=A0A495RYS8_9FLAO|nr:hypothetical protein [Flavobacterium limicola]RKS92717.1 hypothetical protein BC952_2633 [Flavobacterium limicola]